MPAQRWPKTVLQFSLRSVLGMTAILSVLLAVFVPLIQAQPPALRRYLVWGILIYATLAGVGFVVLCLRRRRIETRGGGLLFRPERLPLWLEYLPSAIIAVVCAGFLVGGCVFMLSLLKEGLRMEQELRRPVGLGIEFIFACMGIHWVVPMLGLVYVTTLSWWRFGMTTLEIRENGVGVGGVRFFPWSAIDRCQWKNGKHAAVLTIVRRTRFFALPRKCMAMIPFDARESIERLLDENGIQLQGD